MNWNIKHRLKATSKEARLKEIKEYLLYNRGISPADEQNFLNPPFPTPDSLLSALPDLDQSALHKAVTRLKTAINKGEPILIYGDYDCDGVCSTAILWRTLFNLNALVYPFIPHRIEHGYGLSPKGLKDALDYLKTKSNKKPLLVTVDNGITAHEAAQELKSQEIDLIITDHHAPKDSLPEAYAIVHTTHLSGSGVAYLLASTLNDLHHQPEILGFAALGTVCDLLPLLDSNRQIVSHGLKALRFTTNPGLNSLYQITGITDPTKLSTYHLGYLIGPQINAVGRLGHALDALRLLCTTKESTAQSLAQLLSQHNLNRQDLTTKYTKEAIDHFSLSDNLPSLLFLASPQYHEGIIGLIASKLTEHFNRPSIVVSLKEDLAKASARSIHPINITEHISLAQDLLMGFGGHKGAAGFSFDPQNLQSIQNLLEQEANLRFDPKLFTPSLEVEIEIHPDDLDFHLLQLVEELAPFGINNHSPVFSTTLPVQNTRLLGKKNDHLKIFLTSPYHQIDVIGFNMGERIGEIKDSLSAAFSLNRNTFNGKTSLQLILKDFQSIGGV